jgi:hypothetical protein
MDQKGYVMSGMSFLLIIPAIILCFTFLNVINGENQINQESIQSDTVSYASTDIKQNIPLLTREVLENVTQQVIENNVTVSNSPDTIKIALQSRINEIGSSYLQKGMKINCTINSVHSSSEDPFYLEINSTLNISQNNISHLEQLSQQVSIEGLMDPLPFVKCRDYGGVNHTSSRILYGSSLSHYLSEKGVANANYYENATAPLIIKKCPYDPYISHGNMITLKNCLENGFFHESSDGSCFLCRLEGKGVCPHYGFETFIIPAPVNNSSQVIGPCSSDHVIYNTSTYSGATLCYCTDNETHYIFLDNSHRSKYGLPLFIE